MRLFIRYHQRSIALLSNDHCLTLRYVPQAQQCLIQYRPVHQTDLSGYEEVIDRQFLGLVGVLSDKRGHSFVCVITEAAPAGSPRPGETVYKVKDVEFYCLSSAEFEILTKGRYGSEHNRDKYDREHPCAKIGRLLMSGFYYSRDFDITNVLQERGLALRDYNQIYGNFERKFLWNFKMVKELLKFRDRILQGERDTIDRSEFLTFLVRGFVKSVHVSDDALLTIISKISCARLDETFGLSGVDENGFVSNFVETEILYYNHSDFFAYTQVRGNVPLFYEIEKVLANKKITFTQSKELNEIAFEKHFDSLSLTHGSVVVINCLKSKTVEDELNSRYKYFLNKKGIPNISVDLTRDILRNSPHKLVYQIKNPLLEIGAFCYDIKKKVYIGKQLGVFRINSLNSMEKPGIIEKIISNEVLELSLKEVGSEGNGDIPLEFYSTLKNKHNSLWDENNYVLQTIYEKSLSKAWKKSFDGMIQKVTLYDPFHEFISNELKKRETEFTSTDSISVWSGTFNVNGETSDVDIASWLIPAQKHDIAVVALEEVVELTTSKMLVTDDSKKKFWEGKIKRTLNTSGSKYSLIWSNQLGGIVLLFYVKEDNVVNIKDINGMVKKTGFGGMSANKGGVALSFLYSSTRFCFIAAHLAAGLENVEQRHNDYKTISKNIRFSRGRRIKDHDSIIWMGDFNYRILLSNEQVRAAIHHKNWGYLFEYDQLNKQMVAGESFPYFNEKEIKFAPTYKFDKGTHNYDTSDKLRIPAWTDRILSRGSNLIQHTYNSAPDIIFSDHRPIYATFTAEVKIVNDEMKHYLTKELYETRKRELDKRGLKNLELMMLQQTQTNGRNIGVLPPPSSDKAKWWLGAGQQVKMQLDVPSNAITVNPLRSANPFEDNGEPDFI